MNALCKVREIDKGSITVACDNKSSLFIFFDDFLPNPSKSDYDLVKMLWHGLQESPIKWRPQHVDGHQDDHKSSGFTRMELLNIDMDSIAK